MLLIREFKPIDLKRVYEIESKSFKDPYDVIYLLNLYEMYHETFLVALKDGFIVGYVISRVVNMSGHVLAIAVDPPYRKQCIGASLMGAVTRKLEDRGIINIRLEVRISNKEAIHFYKKLNFKETGIFPSYYSDGEDAIVLKKILCLA